MHSMTFNIDKGMLDMMKSVSGKVEIHKKVPNKNEIMKDSLFNMENVEDDEQVALKT